MCVCDCVCGACACICAHVPVCVCVCVREREKGYGAFSSIVLIGFVVCSAVTYKGIRGVERKKGWGVGGGCAVCLSGGGWGKAQKEFMCRVCRFKRRDMKSEYHSKSLLLHVDEQQAMVKCRERQREGVSSCIMPVSFNRFVRLVSSPWLLDVVIQKGHVKIAQLWQTCCEYFVWGRWGVTGEGVSYVVCLFSFWAFKVIQSLKPQRSGGKYGNWQQEWLLQMIKTERLTVAVDELTHGNSTHRQPVTGQWDAGS